jgi:hypothetical protein
VLNHFGLLIRRQVVHLLNHFGRGHALKVRPSSIARQASQSNHSDTSDAAQVQSTTERFPP